MLPVRWVGSVRQDSVRRWHLVGVGQEIQFGFLAAQFVFLATALEHQFLTIKLLLEHKLLFLEAVGIVGIEA